MGKNKKGFNWKARQSSNETSGSAKCQVEVKLEGIDASTGYDDSNALVLPTHKEKKKKKEEPVKKVKRLTKKERRKLEGVVLQKQKKLKREGLLESLAQHQASSEELQSFLSISDVQTGKNKRKHDTGNNSSSKVNILSTKKRKKRRKEEHEEEIVESEESIHTSDMSTDDDDDSDNGDGCIVISDNKQLNQNLSEPSIEVKTEPNDEMLDKTTSGNSKSSVGSKPATSDSLNIKTEATKVVSKSKVKKEKLDVKKATHIPVSRSEDIQNSRLKLPILGEEQVIMETINENPVVIICGETGSGKTTQVPQFLYEAGYAHNGGIIAITEPRRVAAISMSKRVAMEMSLTSREVSYQIRYEGNVTEGTKIKFMTDGVLLKEVQQDFLLSSYKAVIIDEAHERSTYTDILIGLLSRIVPLRHKKGNHLKLIIMSATLRVEDFTENKNLFKVTPPVIKVDARQFPVTVHYNRRTVEKYLDEAYKKICKIHRTLPEGGILVFVTGQQEVHTLCRKLKRTYPGAKEKDRATSSKKNKKENKKKKSTDQQNALPNINLDNYSVNPDDNFGGGEQKHFDPDISDDDLELHDLDLEIDEDDLVDDNEKCSQPLYVLPLYSLLSSEKQAMVFGPVPEGCRLCVVATNVAETSLTIPDIRYVVDTGKTKTKLYDKVTGVSKFDVTWTSKASANQRAGRAGRVGPGHCYRLYSSAVFNDEFSQFTPAEITRRPVDDLVLQMKSMNIDKVLNFPYPTPPAAEQIQAAESLLLNLGALSPPESGEQGKKEKTITPLGKTMSCFPISPRYAKMLAIGHQQNLLPYVIAIVSALSVQELFVEVYSNPQDDKQKDTFRDRLITLSNIKRRWAGSGHSMLLGDLMVMLKAIGACEYEGGSAKFCEDHGIRYKAMKEVRKLRMQLTNTVNMVVPNTNICIDPKLSPPDETQAKLLRQVVLAGMADHVARKLPESTLEGEDAKKLRKAYQCQELEEPVYIHPSSVLYKECPEFVVYQHIQETSKLYMKGIVAVEPDWFPVFCPSYVTLSKPLESPPPDYDDIKHQVTCHMTGTFGRCCWKIEALSLEYPRSIDKMKWFAKFLLEGRVIHGFKQFTPDLLSTPSTMVKSWAKLQPRTESLLKTLANRGVDNRESLIQEWNRQPTYLLSAMKEWLPESRHADLIATWPPSVS